MTLVEPLGGTLAAGRTYRFRLRAPGAIEVSIVVNGQWTHLARDGGDFSVQFAAVPGDITVYAKYDAASEYTALLKYTGR